MIDHEKILNFISRFHGMAACAFCVLAAGRFSVFMLSSRSCVLVGNAPIAC